LGSATLELDQAGNVISYEEYHPYGSTAFSATSASSEVSAKRYRYTGKERDEETGLYYHGARYYAPWLGRWTAIDPKGIATPGTPDLNLFAYVRCRPISAIDPDGTDDASPPLTKQKRPNAEPKPPAAKEENEPSKSNKKGSSAKEHSYYHNYPNLGILGFDPHEFQAKYGALFTAYLAKRLGVNEAEIDPRVVELVLAQSALETTYGKDLFNWNLGNVRAGKNEDHVYVEHAYEDYATKPAAEAVNRENGGRGSIAPHGSGFRITYPREEIPGARFASYASKEEGVKGFFEKPVVKSFAKKNQPEVRTSVGEAAVATQKFLAARDAAGKPATLDEAARFYHKELGLYATGSDYVFALKLRVVQMNADRDPAFYRSMKKQHLAL